MEYPAIILLALAAGFAGWRASAAAFPVGKGPGGAPGGDRGHAGRAAQAAGKLARRLGAVVPESRGEKNATRTRLACAGMRTDPVTWQGMRVLSVLVGMLAGAYLASMASAPAAALAAVAALTALGWYLPRFYLSARTKRRVGEIEAALPDSLELLAMAVSSGATLEQGFRMVARKTQGPLADEFAAMDVQVSRLGATRSAALADMAKRCGSRSVSAFCSAMVQGLKQGAPVSRILERQARVAREKWFDALEERANRIPAKMTIPLVCCFVPCTMIVAMAPTVSTLLDFLGTL